MTSKYSITSVAVTPEGKESMPITVVFETETSASISDIASSFEGNPFTKEIEGKETVLSWIVKSIVALEEDTDLIEISAFELKELRNRARSIDEKYQVFAGEMYRYLDEFISGAESKQLSMDLLVLNLKDLFELAGKNFNKEAAAHELAESGFTLLEESESIDLMKESIKKLDDSILGLMTGIDSGTLESFQIKTELQKILDSNKKIYH